MTLVGLIGWPVAHSISPNMHNAAFKALEMDGWLYDLLPVAPVDLADKVMEFVEAGYRGFNVSVPHKEAVLDLVDEANRSDSVRAIGAVNTLIVQDSVLHADNTDWQGFRDDVVGFEIEVRYRPCVILGTGGSAKAIDYALGTLGAEPIIRVSRSGARGRGIIGYDALDTIPEGSLIINATPVGMSPQVQDSPWPDGVAFPKGAAVYDLVYNPPMTRLMKQAQAAGIHDYTGLGMLVRQAELSFELWTGSRPPAGVMKQAAKKALDFT